MFGIVRLTWVLSACVWIALRVRDVVGGRGAKVRMPVVVSGGLVRACGSVLAFVSASDAGGGSGLPEGWRVVTRGLPLHGIERWEQIPSYPHVELRGRSATVFDWCLVGNVLFWVATTCWFGRVLGPKARAVASVVPVAASVPLTLA